AHDRRFVGPVFVLFVFVLIIVVVGISRRCCLACGENLVDATWPLLLQTSVEFYGVGGSCPPPFELRFEGLACSGASPSESAYRRLCRSDFATTVRRANSFALVLHLRLHCRYSGCPVQRLTCRCKPLFRAAFCTRQAASFWAMGRAGHSQPARFADDKSRPATGSEGRGAPPKLADASHSCE